MIQHAQKLLLAALLLLVSAAQAQALHSLNEGRVRFQAPANWQLIMEKSDGEPQAVIFQAPLSIADAMDDAATATIKTRSVSSATAFEAFIADEMTRASNLDDYERDAQTGASTHVFTNQRGDHRVRTVDTFLHLGSVGVKVRCQQPIAEGAWDSAFEAQCTGVAASLQAGP